MRRAHGIAIAGGLAAAVIAVAAGARGGWAKAGAPPASSSSSSSSSSLRPREADGGQAALRRATSSADPAEAARWLAIAADAGSAQAAFLLGNAYRAGAGVPQSDAKALAMYERAGERDHAAALQTLSMAYARGELGLEPDDAAARRYAMEAEHALQHAPRSTP